jgi:uncharacterized protein (TIGR02646 family)
VIRINKGTQAPDILLTEGQDRIRSMQREYDADSSAYVSGKKRFTFDNTIYAHPTVKSALRAAQHEKCSFCESIIADDGDVEHYRPKAGMCQGKRQAILKPGYYWLAYDWDNLLLCCSICNQRFKRNYFPLEVAKDRARSHKDDLSAEKPLFIHPAHIDPEMHIGFRDEVAKDLTPPGKSTIEGLDLNRTSLTERRRDKLNEILTLAAFAEADILALPEHLRKFHEKAQQIVEKALSDRGEFSAMIRCALKTSTE